MILGFILGFFWFALFFVGHVLYFVNRPDSERAKIIFRILIFVLLGEMVTVSVANYFTSIPSNLIYGEIFMGILWGHLTILCLFVLYIPFYYAIDRSLSLQSIILIDNSPDGYCRIKQLQKNFVSRSLVADRLNTMKENGYLIKYNGDYMLTPRGRCFVRSFIFMKKIWGLGPGG